MVNGNIISKIRKFVGKTDTAKRIFNRLGGGDYAVYDCSNIILGAKCIDYFVTFDGAKYKVDGCSKYTVNDTRSEYDWTDIRPDDIVLDIGANIGGFAIGAALRAKHVYAVEPIFYKELEENIKLNNISNITVLPFALGDGIGNVDLDFILNQGERKNVPTYTIAGIKKVILDQYNNLHNISFLKCDVEGYEWYINPSDLDGIRRLELEIHPKLPPTESYNTDLISYIKQHWRVNLTEVGRITYMLHAYERGK